MTAPARTRARPAVPERRRNPAQGAARGRHPASRQSHRPPGPPRPPVTARRPPGGRPGDPRRRLVAFLVTVLLGFLVIAGRLVQVQGVAADRYAAIGESQRVRTIDRPAERGSIFDRDGRDLALSVRQSTVWANPRLVTDPRATAEALAPILGEDPAAMLGRLTSDRAFVYLARKVNDGVAAQVRALALEGVNLVDEPQRFFPAGDLGLPLLGQVGLDNNGLSGLELQYESQLRGEPGRVVLEREPGGRDIPGGVREFTPSVRGDDLVLTIDRSLQYETERALTAEIVRSHAKGGIAVVMHTRTGEILAMANIVADDGVSPRPADKNMAVTNVYEPGSVNKMITVTAALEERLVKPDDRLTVASTIKVADHVFKEHDPHPTEQWSITDIVANSSNVGSIMIGQKLGKERLDRYMRSFGFGKKTPIAFPGESAGLLLDPKKYSGTSMGTMPIGQGVAVTALQMLAAYNTVANDGVYVSPKLVAARIDGKGVRHDTPESPTRRVISSRTAQQMTAMLGEVVRVGTGKLAAIDGYSVAGKTGTARKPLEGARGYKAGAYVSSFAGFVPAERPELAAIVMLDEPTPIFGGIVAAPVFAEISRYALRQFRIPPPPPSTPPAAASVPQTNAKDAQGVGEAGAAEVPATTIPASRPSPTTP